MLSKKIERYMDLIIDSGLNIIKGDHITIFGDIKIYDFIQKITEKMYKKGASLVVVEYTDEELLRQKCKYAEDKFFDIFPEYRKIFFDDQLKLNSKRLSLISPDLEKLKNTDSSKLMRLEKSSKDAMKHYRDAVTGDKINWTLAGVANKEWAKKIFPNIPSDEAYEKLWDVIFNCVHIGEENVNDSWAKHQKKLIKIAKTLTNLKLKELHYKNSLGTDLIIGLPDGHVWLGGRSQNVKTKQKFSANIPTEEVYTLADCNNINGVVYSSKALVHGGKIIDKFKLIFEKGKVIDFKAEVGEDMLKEILSTDESSRSLGEVALVPYSSPISKSGILFYNTLFDENASCHLALGQAYETSLPGIEGKTEEEMKKMGFNKSLSHVDFMIGTEDLSITGKDINNNFVKVFTKGEFDEKIIK